MHVHVRMFVFACLYVQQWVKLREGTQPIEVPPGANPQQFLEGLRASNYPNRFLAKKKAYIPIAKKAAPPPPTKKMLPPVTKKTTIIVRPTKKTPVMPTKKTPVVYVRPSKKTPVMPTKKTPVVPSKKGTVYVPVTKARVMPTKKSAPPPVYGKGMRPMYVAARPMPYFGKY